MLLKNMKAGVSIIVSSCNENSFLLFQRNVEYSVGCDFEIIKIYNPGKYSLCAAYNMGIKQAQFNYVCFVHDDVEFLVDNWGKHCVAIFESTDNCGLIGVAGTAYKTWLAGSWFSTYTRNYCRGKIRQSNKNRKTFREDDFDCRINKTTLSKVVCIDGVFMFTSYKIAKEIGFDEKRFNGFHCYDLDFSTSVFLLGYNVLVDREMYICHYSPGLFGPDFAKYARKYVRKYWNKLPLCSESVSFKQILCIEFRTWYSFMKRLAKKIIMR